MYIGYSCSYVKNGTLQYAIYWDKDGADDAPANNFLLRDIIVNGNMYGTTGDTSKGIPAPMDVNFLTASPEPP